MVERGTTCFIITFEQRVNFNVPVIVFWVIIDSLIYSSTLDIFASQECEWLKKVRHALSSICKLNP